jgi:hypothetical protein
MGPNGSKTRTAMIVEFVQDRIQLELANRKIDEAFIINPDDAKRWFSKGHYYIAKRKY